MNKANDDYATFLERGNNRYVVASILFGSIFLLLAYSLYKSYECIWLASAPIILFAVVMFSAMVKNSYKDKLKKQNRGSRMKLVGFNMDFNERVLRRIYGSLTQYEYLDENLTTFEHFQDVMVLDFDKHKSVLYFNCTQAELKYILEKFKPFKKGLGLAVFERSGKIYNKGKLISSESLSKSYNKNRLTQETEDLIDSFFNFLGEI